MITDIIAWSIAFFIFALLIIHTLWIYRKHIDRYRLKYGFDKEIEKDRRDKGYV